MTLKYSKSNRRTFLQGSLGFSLAIPFLPSLLIEKTNAAPFSNPARFLAFTYSHGGVYNGNFYPPSLAEGSHFTESLIHSGNSTLPSHIIRHGTLSNFRSTIDGQLKLSQVMSEKLNPFLNEMNILRGLDIPLYAGHHYGMALGSIYNMVNGSKEGLKNMPTIDQILAYNPKFYPSVPAFRSINTGNLSYSLTNPSNLDSPVLRTPIEANSIPRRLFDQLFGTNSNFRAELKVVDRVLESYRKLRSHSRISAADKVKLEKAMNDYSELETRLNLYKRYSEDDSFQGSVGAPEQFTTNRSYDVRNNPTEKIEYVRDMAKIFALAFKTNATKIITHSIGTYLNTLNSDMDWHGHAHDFHNKQGELISHARNTLDTFVVTLLEELSSEESNGNTYLDNTLIYMMPENSMTHSNYNNHILTWGGANLGIKTGRYIDYSNRENGDIIHSEYDNNRQRLYNDNMNRRGLLQNSLWVSIFQAMGLNQSDYEIISRKGETRGWGDYFGTDKNKVVTKYDDKFVESPLPFYF